MDNKEAQKLLKEWCNRLGLTDWKIKLYINCTEAETDNACGLSEWQETLKTARINIVDEKYYGERIIPFDFEKTLVHELLHLKMCLLTEGDDSLQDRIVHILIDDFARAFVDAKRAELHSVDTN